MTTRRRIILFPLPFQGHINPMLQLANILHSQGFSIIIVHIEYNPSNYPHFTFKPITDRFFETESNISPDADPVVYLNYLNETCVGSFKECVVELLAESDDEGSVCCLITDAGFYFPQAVANELSIPRLVLRTSSVASVLVYGALTSDNLLQLTLVTEIDEIKVFNVTEVDILKEMTTSSANNSVFRGFFEKQNLTGPNFIDWYRQLRIVLSIEDKLNYLEQPLPPAPVAPAGQHVAPEILAAHTAWVKGSKKIAGLMLMTMEPEIQQNLKNLHANDMLNELKTLFAQQAEQELLQTTRDFHSCKQEEGQSVSSYVLKMKGYIDNLGRLGHPVTLSLAVSLILIGLRKEFDGFVRNYNMHSLGKTVYELHAMLKLHEQTLPKNNAHALHAIRAGKVQKSKKHNKLQPQKAARGQNHGNRKNKHAYAPKPKIPPPPKKEDPPKDSICHECGETGHWKRNCPQYLAELLKKKKNTAFGAGGGSGQVGN
ncbi:zinc finger, CCHC-type containing protein [Tanacetum coccineum]